jgi:DNA-binding NarL/FixJ family response regulator
MSVWSDRELSTLQEMASQGASVQRIAARLQRSTMSVKARARELGLLLKTNAELRAAYGVDRHWSVDRAARTPR